jgi:hypothetical protein
VVGSQAHPKARQSRCAFRSGPPLALVLLGAIAANLAPLVAHAQRLEARYAVSMTGIPVGKSAWSVDIGSDAYTISASGGAAGILSILMAGEGIVEASGKIRSDRLVPVSFTTSSVEDGEKVELKMTLDDGVATAIVFNGPPPGPDRVPLTDVHRRGVVDPLTALLLDNSGAGSAPAPATCDRPLNVFDGRRRYDLLLSFNRIDQLTEPVYAGALLVCNVVLRPIAGHRANSPIMKYVASRRDMEIAFAPIKGTRLLAPFRLSVPTLLGTMGVQATQFDQPGVTAPGAR